MAKSLGDLFPPDTNVRTFVEVIMPMALPKPYTYEVPTEFLDHIGFGQRVEVQLGKSKVYAGLVVEVHQRIPEGYRPKPILGLIDDSPIVLHSQVKFWHWLAGYYCCTLGEVMHAALPANLKLASETVVCLSPEYEQDMIGLDDQEFLVTEALTIQSALSLGEIRQILNRKTVYPVIKRLIEKRIIYLREELQDKYQSRRVSCLRLQEPWASEPRRLDEAFELLSRSSRQTEALMAFIQLSRQAEYVRRADVVAKAKVDYATIHAMVKKGVMEIFERDVSRLPDYGRADEENPELSPGQQEALMELQSQLEEKPVALLHGVTGSGKTLLYVELIKECIRRQEQVLYLLPEIALTTQVIDRLKRIFGEDIAVYHSRLSNNERVELWQAALGGKSVLMGARSALLLPFKKLKLVIVDEEHDPSYKQSDPNPRYQGRDAAIYLANMHGAKVVLGTATPSLESFYNADKGKYGLVSMPDRFGGLQLPEVQIVDAKRELLSNKKQSHFTSTLIEAISTTLEDKEQVILFQNRRGYAPTYRCGTCDWYAECIHCDVSLTYHRHHHKLKCHYCGYQASLPTACPACGNRKLTILGFGTQKIEDELKIYLPDARIARMDLDTTRSKKSHGRMIRDFDEGRTDILVGTQMVTKGLDFEHVGLVGVLSADQLLHFPDFRAAERAFQLMTQVSGRAGRKKRRGKVIIQAYNTAHPVLQDVIGHDFKAMYEREIQERYAFRYPPFARLIAITLRHRKPEVLERATLVFTQLLKGRLGEWAIGPAVPYISRLRGYYLRDYLVKLDRKRGQIEGAKKHILECVELLHAEDGLSGVRIAIDVDPM